MNVSWRTDSWDMDQRDPALDLWPHRCDAFLVSYLPLCSLDGGGFEEEGVIWLVVVVVGGGENDLLQSGVVPADVVRRARHEAAMTAAMTAARQQRRPWETRDHLWNHAHWFNSRTGQHWGICTSVFLSCYYLQKVINTLDGLRSVSDVFLCWHDSYRRLRDL